MSRIVNVYHPNGETVAFQADEDFAHRLIAQKKARTSGRPGTPAFKVILRIEVRVPRHIGSLTLADLSTDQKLHYRVQLSSGVKSYLLKRYVNGDFERWPGT